MTLKNLVNEIASIETSWTKLAREDRISTWSPNQRQAVIETIKSLKTIIANANGNEDRIDIVALEVKAFYYALNGTLRSNTSGVHRVRKFMRTVGSGLSDLVSGSIQLARDASLVYVLFIVFAFFVYPAATLYNSCKYTANDAMQEAFFIFSDYINAPTTGPIFGWALLISLATLIRRSPPVERIVSKLARALDTIAFVSKHKPDPAVVSELVAGLSAEAASFVLAFYIIQFLGVLGNMTMWFVEFMGINGWRFFPDRRDFKCADVHMDTTFHEILRFSILDDEILPNKPLDIKEMGKTFRELKVWVDPGLPPVKDGKVRKQVKRVKEMWEKHGVYVIACIGLAMGGYLAYRVWARGRKEKVPFELPLPREGHQIDWEVAISTIRNATKCLSKKDEGACRKAASAPDPLRKIVIPKSHRKPCAATTSRGRPCRNYAEPGSKTCRVH